MGPRRVNLVLAEDLEAIWDLQECFIELPGTL